MLGRKTIIRILAFTTLILAFVCGAHAATIGVNSTGDSFSPGDGACTLREAIENAGAAGDLSGGDCLAGVGGVDTITFLVSGTITLTNPLPNVITDVTIDGGNNITISGNSAVQVIGDVTGSLELKNLTVTKAGNGVGNGAIVNDNNLTITHCTFSNNKATTGAAIVNGGTLTVSDSTFTNNSAPNGGAIYGNDTDMTITNSTFTGNTASGGNGGAIFHNASFAGAATSILTVSGCTFSNNTGPNDGDGGAIQTDGKLFVSNTTFSGNVTSSGGHGGAIHNEGPEVSITNCTFSGNSATNGELGGAINSNGGSVTVTNSIIANSPSGGNCFGAITDGGNNLDSDGTCGFISGITNPSLDPAGLESHGGRTKTIALQPGSPAIDAGDDTTCNSAPINGVDQRGLARSNGTHCDIGAYEFGLLYFDDYSDNESSDWSPTKGVWSATTSTLVGTNIKKADDISPFLPGCTDCTIEVDIAPVSPGVRVWVLGWYKDKKNYVEIELMQDKSKIQLKQHSNGTAVAKGSTFFAINAGQTYHVKIAFASKNFSVFVDSNPIAVLSVGTTVNPLGGVGARLKSTTGLSATAHWDNWLVY